MKWDDAAAHQWLKARLSEKRYQHSVGTQQKAVELARYYKLPQEDIEKVAVAGLMHDAAKLMSPEELIEACERYYVHLKAEDRQSPQTIHGLVAAELVRQTFHIHDSDVLNAIRYHTTGCAEMSPVEKIVFIADKIEGNTRNPLYTQKIHSLLNFPDLTALDEVMLYILDSTIHFLIDKKQPIHPRTIESRNDLLEKIKERTHPVHAL